MDNFENFKEEVQKLDDINIQNKFRKNTKNRLKTKIALVEKHIGREINH